MAVQCHLKFDLTQTSKSFKMNPFQLTPIKDPCLK